MSSTFSNANITQFEEPKVEVTNISSDTRLKLLANLPIDVGNGIHFHTPTLEEIIQIGESRYNELLSIMLLDKRSIESLAEDETITNFHILYANCYHSSEFMEAFKESAQFFFKEEVHRSPEHLGVFFYFGDILEERFINEENFEFIQSLIMVANNVSFKEEDYDPFNERARKLVEEIKQIKEEVAKKKEKIDDFESKISGLAWKSNMNIFDVFKLSIYQFYDGLLRLEQVDSYQFTLTGVYAGTVSSDKIKMSDLHWTKKLK